MESKSEKCATTKRILGYIPFFAVYLHHRTEGEEDAFVVCECYDLRAGEQFVLHHIITRYDHTYPGPRVWPAREYRIPNNFQTMFTNVRACQYLLAEELLKHLAEKLQVEPQMLWRNPHSVRNLVWGRYKVANFK